MKLNLVKILFILSVVFFCNVNSELSADEVTNLLQIYEITINASLSLSRDDKELIISWVDEHQVKQVNVTTKVRLEMAKHKKVFRRDDVNQKWTQCLDFYSNDVAKPERQYYIDESICLKSSNKDSEEKRQGVDQLEREIKKWRKSYKYLSRLCEKNNSGDKEGANACLVENIERDNYIKTLQRLMLLKLEAMAQLCLQLMTSIDDLEECLQAVLSDYLNRVRSMMKILHKCYNGSQEE